MTEDIKMIPIDQIRILNPRFRDKRRFERVVESIRNLGLKKPIRVSFRSTKDGEEPGYDLVYGQGRIEAFLALGYKEIPAIVGTVSKADRLLMSLVENMARRFPCPMDLIAEMERLKAEGYTHAEIGRKLDISGSHVSEYLTLKNSGEERLLDAVVKGRLSVTLAIEISKCSSTDMQRELLKAHEQQKLNFTSLRALRRLIEQRRFLGKSLKSAAGLTPKKARTTAEAMVSAFRKQSEKQKLLVKKAHLCETNLLILVTAFKQLLADSNFVSLLKAEGLATLPTRLSEKLKETSAS